MKLAEIPLKKHKASGICAYEKCKTKEGLTSFQHPVGPIALCTEHAGSLDAGESVPALAAATTAGVSVPCSWCGNFHDRGPEHCLKTENGLAVSVPESDSRHVQEHGIRIVIDELAARTKAAEELLALAQALPVERNEDVEMCAAIFQDVKSKQVWLDDTSEWLLRPLREAEKAAQFAISTYQKPLLAIKDVLRQKVADYADALAKLRQELAAGMAAGTVSPEQLAQTEMPVFDGLLLSEVWDVEILDIEAVTALYVEKKLNRALVLDHARMAEQTGTRLEVPGLKIFKKKQVAVRKKKDDRMAVL